MLEENKILNVKVKIFRIIDIFVKYNRIKININKFKSLYRISIT